MDLVFDRCQVLRSKTKSTTQNKFKLKINKIIFILDVPTDNVNHQQPNNNCNCLLFEIIFNKLERINKFSASNAKKIIPSQICTVKRVKAFLSCLPD